MVEGNEDALLSDAETSALLDAMQAAEFPTGPKAEATQLGSPEGPLRAALTQVDLAASKLANAGRLHLLRQTARGVDVHLLATEIVPRDVIDSNILPTSLVYRLENRDTSTPYGRIIVDALLARFILDLSMGASDDDSARSGPLTQVSRLDRRILDPLPHALADCLAEELFRNEPISLNFKEMDEDQKSQVRFEPMMRLGLRFLSAGNPVGDVTVVLTTAALGGHAAAAMQASAQRSAIHRNQMAQRLASAKVPVAAVLGRTASSVRALLSLQVGDVLRLDSTPEDPVHVSVEGHPFALGNPIVHHGDLAIQITERKL